MKKIKDAISTFSGWVYARAFAVTVIVFSPFLFLLADSFWPNTFPKYGKRIGQEISGSLVILATMIPVLLLLHYCTLNESMRFGFSGGILIATAASAFSHFWSLLKEFIFPFGPEGRKDEWSKLVDELWEPKQSAAEIKADPSLHRATQGVRVVIGGLSKEVYIRLCLLFIGVRFFLGCLFTMISFGVIFYLLQFPATPYFSYTRATPSIIASILFSIGTFTTAGFQSISPKCLAAEGLMIAEVICSVFLLTVFIPVVFMIFERNLRFWTELKEESINTIMTGAKGKPKKK